jgi:prolipoprotein diacylglyceryltransferase
MGHDGVPRHPVQLYEMIFHIVAGVVGILCVRRKWFRGCVFSLYLVAYGAFRLLTETIRETPQSFGGLSSYQWASLAMMLIGAAFFVKRSYFPSEAWKSHLKAEMLPATQ